MKHKLYICESRDPSRLACRKCPRRTPSRLGLIGRLLNAIAPFYVHCGYEEERKAENGWTLSYIDDVDQLNFKSRQWTLTDYDDNEMMTATANIDNVFPNNEWLGILSEYGFAPNDWMPESINP